MNKVIGIVITLAVCAGLVVCGSLIAKKNSRNADDVSSVSETALTESTSATAEFTQIEFDEFTEHTVTAQPTETAASEDRKNESQTSSSLKGKGGEEQLTNIWDLFNQGLEEEYAE